MTVGAADTNPKPAFSEVFPLLPYSCHRRPGTLHKWCMPCALCDGVVAALALGLASQRACFYLCFMDHVEVALGKSLRRQSLLDTSKPHNTHAHRQPEQEKKDRSNKAQALPEDCQAFGRSCTVRGTVARSLTNKASARLDTSRHLELDTTSIVHDQHPNPCKEPRIPTSPPPSQPHTDNPTSSPPRNQP